MAGNDFIDEDHESLGDTTDVMYRCKNCDYHTSDVKEMQQHVNLHMVWENITVLL